jgi:hypothetical protein
MTAAELADFEARIRADERAKAIDLRVQVSAMKAAEAAERRLIEYATAEAQVERLALAAQVAALRALLVEADDGHGEDCDVNRNTPESMSGCSCQWQTRTDHALADTANAAAEHDAKLVAQQRQLDIAVVLGTDNPLLAGGEVGEAVAQHDAAIRADERAKTLAAIEKVLSK